MLKPSEVRRIFFNTHLKNNGVDLKGKTLFNEKIG